MLCKKCNHEMKQYIGFTSVDWDCINTDCGKDIYVINKSDDFINLIKPGTYAEYYVTPTIVDTILSRPIATFNLDLATPLAKEDKLTAGSSVTPRPIDIILPRPQIQNWFGGIDYGFLPPDKSYTNPSVVIDYPQSVMIDYKNDQNDYLDALRYLTRSLRRWIHES